MQKGYHSLKLSVSEFIVKMIIYPACYYCLFTSCKKVRLRKTIDKEYYSKGYILYLLVAGAKDYKVNVLHHYDKKKIASFQVNGFWFAPLCITLYRIDNTYVGLLLLHVAILQIFELWWILLLTNQKSTLKQILSNMAAAMYKFFIGKGYQLFSHQIQYKLYENCYILKPEFSQSQNADIYLLLITSTRTFFLCKHANFGCFYSS